jgi:hypothetical protein
LGEGEASEGGSGDEVKKRGLNPLPPCSGGWRITPIQ